MIVFAIRLFLTAWTPGFYQSACRKMYEGPIVVILGATGAGKSKLALDIAQKLNGEIVSADSMQVYKGLDIVTNKVTPEEQEICRHHLIGFLRPLDEYTIVDFKKHALNAIKDIQSRKKLPIICGGTVYYIESILWQFLLPTNEKSLENEDKLVRSLDYTNQVRKELEAIDSEELYKMLEQIDPEKAARTHPNDTRRVIRSIEIFQQSGQKHSHLLKLQTGERRVGGPLLFKNTCFIWVKCDKEVLHERVDRRVNKMIDSGLLKELQTFHEDYNRERIREGLSPDYERGIFQSIGFKEFHKYLTEKGLGEMEKEKLLRESVDRMKLSTWQYAKYQVKWLNRRIVNRSASLPVYSVDATDPAAWKQKALYPAIKLLQHELKWADWVEEISESSKVFQEKEVIESENLEAIHRKDMDGHPLSYEKRICNICGGKILITDQQWEVHIKSKKHKRTEAGQKRRLYKTVEILAKHKEKLETGEVEKEISEDYFNIFQENENS